MKRALGFLVAGTLAFGAAPAYADHERPRCEDGYCYDDRDSHRNENSRGRDRGAFSPGPFDDSPVDAFNNNVVCLPGSTCHFDGDRNREQQPSS